MAYLLDSLCIEKILYTKNVKNEFIYIDIIHMTVGYSIIMKGEIIEMMWISGD